MSSIFKQLGCGATIGIIGGIIGALVGLWGVSMAGTGAVIGYLVFVFLFFGVFWKLMFQPMIRANRLMAVGVEADATILSLAETGSSLQVGGSIPKAGVRFQLEIRPDGKPPFQAQTTTYVSMFEIQKYQPGAVIRVKFDPKDPQKVVIAEGTPALGRFQAAAPAGAAVPAANAAEFQKMADQMVAEQQRLFAVGVEAPARVKRMTETDITINGDNPLVELTLEVTPADGATFTADTKAVVVRASLYKFEPGRTIQVKFDPGDRTKVTVFHS
ncbi:MAG: DUF3592 domain-containing protein [Candidatus Aminicenantales bacterium]|jgi:hypothetical protein